MEQVTRWVIESWTRENLRSCDFFGLTWELFDDADVVMMHTLKRGDVFMPAFGYVVDVDGRTTGAAGWGSDAHPQPLLMFRGCWDWDDESVPAVVYADDEHGVEYVYKLWSRYGWPVKLLKRKGE